MPCSLVVIYGKRLIDLLWEVLGSNPGSVAGVPSILSSLQKKKKKKKERRAKKRREQEK